MKNILLIIVAGWLASFACKKDDAATTVEKKFYRWDEFNMGVDLSYVNQIEDYGGVYSDSGKVKDCFKILKDNGAHKVRVLLLNTPNLIVNMNNVKMYYDLFVVENRIRDAK